MSESNQAKWAESLTIGCGVTIVLGVVGSVFLLLGRLWPVFALVLAILLASTLLFTCIFRAGMWFREQRVKRAPR